ncbi:hypothetical protein AA313_de0202628 [Arthrobotrys entomopaga]|nr:hypothetical protein AA313_de0202628 [Arthrobotrys entomopaga]
MGPDNIPDLRLDRFTCGSSGRINILNYNDLYTSLSNHLNWYSKTPTRLISMFRTERRAMRWARKYLCKHPDSLAYIITINPREITNAAGKPIPLFGMKDIIERYPDMLPDGIEEPWVDDEYLALYKIPAKAITWQARAYI